MNEIQMAMMLWRGEGKNVMCPGEGASTLDYRQECKTDRQIDKSQQQVGAGMVVQVVQPWRELDFSAVDDDLPALTTLADMCEHWSNGQRADRWQGALSQVKPLTRLLPPPTPVGIT